MCVCVCVCVCINENVLKSCINNTCHYMQNISKVHAKQNGRVNDIYRERQRDRDKGRERKRETKVRKARDKRTEEREKEGKQEREKQRFGLVSLFNGISTLMGYLIPKTSL